MKKLLPLFLVLVLSIFALTACFGSEYNESLKDPENEKNPPSGEVTPEADEDLQAAYDYIKLTYKTLGVTLESFEVMKNAPIGDKIFAITWSTDNADITITESEDGNFYVVNLPEKGAAAVNYALKFSIQNEAGEKKEGSFSLTLPAYAINTFDEYVAAEDGTPLVVQGIVTGVISKSTNSTKENSLFLQDLNGNGGYYIYNLAEDPNGVIKVGMTVEVSGNKKNYNGTYELTSPVAKIIDETIKTVTPVDFTEVLASAAGLDADELVKKNGMLVTIKGVTLLEYLESNGYHYFQLGNHKTYLRVSSSSNCITEDEGKALTKSFQDNFYNAADVTGLIAVYNGAMYLMPVSTNAFANFVEQDKPADVKVDLALDNTKIAGMIQLAGDTELPTTFSGFSDVSIAWELVSGTCASLAGNKLTVTIPAAAEQIVLKATVTCGEISKTKEYTVTVKPISTITIEEANNIGMNMAHNTYTEELYYIVGTVESVANSTYGNLYLVDAEGKYSIYVYGMYDATGKVRYDSMDPMPLPKDVVKVLSAVGKYNNDVQLKNAKVVEITVHEDNKVEAAPEIDFKPVAPIVDTEFFFGMTKNEKVYYITGLMATGNSSFYMASTAKQADAAKITVVAGPDGTYYLKLTVDGATKYMDIVVSGTHKNAVYADAAPETGFYYDAEFMVFYKTFDGSKYTFGTALSNSYTTIGGVKVNADNAMLQISFAQAHVCEFVDVVTAPTCEEKGYTTHTCACGNVVVDSETPALEHDWDADGVCKREGCGAVSHTHEYAAVVTDPTCTAAGYTTYTCTVEGCNKSYTEAGEAALGHIDENKDLDCDREGCGALVLPEDGATLTIAQALKIGAATTTTQKYTVSGMVTGFYGENGTMYGNIYITDGTDTILVYGLYQNGVRYDAMAVKPVEYDVITVSGILSNYKGVGQFKNAELIKHDVHECEYTEATCQALATCEVCGETTGDYAEHNYVDGACSVCGGEQPHEHDYNYEVVVTDPTCTTAGYTTYTCVCGDSYTEDGEAALDHDYDDEGVCQREGCDATSHEHDYEAVVTEPTCTEAGYTTYTCKVCNKTYTDDETEATGKHVYGEGVVTDPTCTAAGYTTYTCACGDSYTDNETEALGHKDENGDYKCDACSTKMLPADGEALTIPQALAIAKLAGTSYTTQKYYITGIVTNVYNTTYGNLYLKDANGNEICIFGLYTWDKSIRYDAMSYKPVEGDELTVYTILGMYNTTAQGKDAWIDEVVAHEHKYVDVVTDPTCTNDGYTTHTCSICNGSVKDTEVEALGHTTEAGVCERCGQEIGGSAPVVKDSVTFEFGANGSATHYDNNTATASQSWTEGAATLKMSGGTKVYLGCRDAKGNSCLKFGTGSAAGSCTFTVDDDVTSVVIKIAKYKTNTAKLTINGASYTLTKNSNDGAYDEIVIATTATKTISITTVSGGYRCMLNSITYNYG